MPTDDKNLGTQNDDEKDKTLNEDDDLDLGLDDDEEEDDEEEDDLDLGLDDEEDPEGDKSPEDYDEKDLEDPEKRKRLLEIAKQAKSALKQKQMWRDRAEKSGWKKDQPMAPVKKTNTKPSIQKSNDVLDEVKRVQERTDFRIDHPDIPRSAIDEIEKYARVHEISLEKAARSPIVRQYVENKVKKDRLSNASPTSKHRSSQTTPPKDWSRATSEEVAAHAAEIRRRAK